MSDNMVTFGNVQVPESDVLKAAAEIQQREKPKPVEPGLYRWSDTTDADPFADGHVIRRKNDGSWDYAEAWGDRRWERASRPTRFIDEDVLNGLLVPLKPVEGVEYEGGDDGMRRRWRNNRWEFWRDSLRCWDVSPSGAYFWRTGQLRPAQSKPWVPKVDEWVQSVVGPWDKARRITDVCDNVARVKGSVVDQSISNLRPATPDEITDAKRIEPVDRLIVRCKADGGVWQYNVEPLCWSRLDCYGYLYGLEYHNLDLDHYDILDEYVVHGAQRVGAQR